MNRLPLFSMALSVLLPFAGCGGGSDASPVSADASPPSPFGVHGAATLQVSTANFKHVSAQAYVAYRALHRMATTPDFLASFVTPSHPSTTVNCGSGSVDVTFLDRDQDGAVSVGDSMVLLNQQCNGMQVSGTLTILAFDPALRRQNAYRTGATSYRFDGSYTYESLADYGVQTTLSGSFAMSPYHGTDLLMKAIGDVSFQSGGNQSLILSNVMISSLDPSSGEYGIGGDCSMDITINTSLVQGQRIQLDTDATLWDWLTSNDAPHPGKIVLRGSAGTKVSVSIAGDDTTTFQLDADTTGLGVADTSATLSAAQFYAAY